VLALVAGYGLWFGHDLLNKWEKTSPPPAVSWTSSRVPLSLMAGDSDQNPVAVSVGQSGQAPSAHKAATGGLEQKSEGAGGKLARTLSDLLGVEISIQANREAIEKGLVLLESGEEGAGWRVVLGEPKQETTPGPATGGGTTDNGKSEPKPPETEKRPFELKPGSMAHGALPAWALILTALVLVITAWRSSRRSALEITADSKDFQEALRIWLPWLMAKQGTPRSVKRFVNWLRYIAVRLRKTAGTDPSRFPETNTVALAAIHYFNPEWLTSDSLYEMVTGCMITALLEPGKGMAAQMDEQQVDQLAVTLTNCVGTYAEWIGAEGLSEEERRRRGEWIPSAEHRDTFLAVISEKAAVS